MFLCSIFDDTSHLRVVFSTTRDATEKCLPNISIHVTILEHKGQKFIIEDGDEHFPYAGYQSNGSKVCGVTRTG